MCICQLFKKQCQLEIKAFFRRGGAVCAGGVWSSRVCVCQLKNDGKLMVNLGQLKNGGCVFDNLKMVVISGGEVLYARAAYAEELERRVRRFIARLSRHVHGQMVHGQTSEAGWGAEAVEVSPLFSFMEVPIQVCFFHSWFFSFMPGCSAIINPPTETDCQIGNVMLPNGQRCV